MRSLEFEIFKKDSLYTVHIGNGDWLRFDNVTRAKTFVRKYKRVIQDNVAMLNLMQPQLNSLYRQNIMSLDDDTQRGVAMELQTFEKRFEFIFKTFSSGNQNAFLFQNIYNCLDALMNVTSLLFDYARRYKQFALKAVMVPIKKNLEMISKQLELDKKNLFVENGYRKEIKVKTIRKAL